MTESAAIDTAGYKDWVIDVMKIPSVTIETGMGAAPVSFQEFLDIYTRNRDVVLAVATWV